jgi:uncharacterized protein CbrC (UPF0167 family)
MIKDDRDHRDRSKPIDVGAIAQSHVSTVCAKRQISSGLAISSDHRSEVANIITPYW